MQPLSCSLLALAAAVALWGQPIRGYNIKHTTVSGEVVESGYTQEAESECTVSELKEKLAKEYQAPKDMFHVIWRGEEMSDYEKTYNYPYYGVFLQFDSALVKVVKPDGSYIVLGGEKKDTVASFKDKIAKKVNVPREMQRLIGKTGELQDGEQLARVHILDPVSCIVSLKWKSARVRVKFPSGEIVTFEFEPFEKVASLKEKIQQAKGVLRELQSLLLKGKGELDDEKLLVDSSLTKSSILTLVVRDPNVLDIIHVRLSSKRLLTFEVSLANDTVASLKGKINQAEGIALEKQHLFLFKGNEMANRKLLSNYVTKNESVVDLLLCSDSEVAIAEHHIHYGTIGEDVGLKLLLNIKPNDTVASVKQAIALRNKTSTANITLHLFSENKELEDDKQMLEHVLSIGSMLQLKTRRNDGPETIHLRVPSGRLITFEPDMAIKVKKLKELIEQEMGPNTTSHKRLFYGDLELSDEKSLYDYDIRSGSSVNLIVAKPVDN